MQQRRAADYLLANQRTAFALSVNELARAAEVSEATVVRFAREVGFSGYHALRAALMDEARRDLSPEARFALEEPSKEPMGTIERIAAREIENIHRTAGDIDPRELRRFVSRLGKAPLIATMGLGVSSILARLAQYLFFQIGMRAELLSREAVTLSEQVEVLPKQAVVLAFSLPPYSRQTIEACACAKRRRIPVLAITDSPASPVHSHAYAALHCHGSNLLYTNSLSGPLLLLNAVVTDLALTRKARTLDHLRATDRAAKDEYL